MLKNKILLISPTWVNIHEDIQRELISMGFEVTFVPENSFAEDPFRIKGKKNEVAPAIADNMKTDYWKKQLCGKDIFFNYLLVIDGQGVNEYLIKLLRTANPDIYCVNYLYDTTYSVYHFEKNFNFFDKVFTFDRGESNRYNIEQFPIYWTPAEEYDNTPHYDVFGFGAYSKNRFELYKFISDIAVGLGKKCFLKTYHAVIGNQPLHVFKNIIRQLTGKGRLISLSEYNSGLVSHELISTTNFRNIIQSSEVVVDTKVLNQNGLTARFMWALGAEKKIITTNEVAKQYAFYSEEQILILDENKSLDSQTDIVRAFLDSDFKMTEDCRMDILRYRLDNWIKKQLNNKTNE